MPSIGLYQEVKYVSSQLEGILERGLSKVGACLDKPDPILIGTWPYDGITDYKTLLQHIKLRRKASVGESAKVVYSKTFQAYDDNVKIPSTKRQENKDDMYFDPTVLSELFSAPNHLDSEVAFFEYQGKEIALHFSTDIEGPLDFMLTGDMGLLEAAFERFLGHPIGPLKYELDDTIDMKSLQEILTREGQSPLDMVAAVDVMVNYISSV